MSRLFGIFGIAAIIVCALTLFGSLEQSGRHIASDPSDVLDGIRHSLADSGLHQRSDVSIEMNEREVALGFSRADCDGLMLVAVLPHTAQGWAHMAPRLDLSAYQLGYLYDGVAYPSVPRLERLVDRLRDDLRPHRTSRMPRVVGVAEAGRCGLARNAARVLEAVSRGGLRVTAPRESKTVTGEISV